MDVSDDLNKIPETTDPECDPNLDDLRRTDGDLDKDGKLKQSIGCLFKQVDAV